MWNQWRESQQRNSGGRSNHGGGHGGHSSGRAHHPGSSGHIGRGSSRGEIPIDPDRYDLRAFLESLPRNEDPDAICNCDHTPGCPTRKGGDYVLHTVRGRSYLNSHVPDPTVAYTSSFLTLVRHILFNIKKNEMEPHLIGS